MRYLIAIMASLTLSALFATSASAKESTVRTQRAELVETMTAWAKHRNQTIAVLNISGLDKASPGASEKTLLEARLETLQRKKISNREWASYWEGEASISRKVAAQYDALSPEKGPRPLLAESRQLMLEADTLRASIKRELTVALDRAQGAARASRNELQSILSERTKTVDARSSDLNRLSTQLDAITSAQAGADPASDQKALTRLQKEHDGLRTEIDAQKLEMDTLRLIFNGGSDTDELKDGTVRARAAGFIKGRADLQAAAKALEEAQTKVNKLVMTSARMSAEDALFRARLPGLSAWAGVAERKVKNQQVYYDAIQADIASINERLRSFKEPSKEEIVYADDVCGRPLTNNETPFAHHRACVAAINLEIDRLNTEKEQASYKGKLTAKLTHSNGELSSAQITDEQLVRDEFKVSDAERKRAAADRKENATWIAIWTTYAKRAASKEGSLSAAVMTSKKSKRMLDAQSGVLSDTIKRLDTQLTEMDGRLQRTDTMGTAAISLLESSLQIIKVGWPALIYILFAWLLIKLINRVRDKKEANAVATQEGDGNDDLAELEAKLAAARAANDDTAQAALHEEIGQLQSRIKDESQRIATIARVAAQAMALIIYVATFLLVLDALTVDIGPILGGAAIFGLAISFGSQSLVKDVVSGFFILLENQYAVGDVVSINDQSGTVEKITLRRTVLRDLCGGVHNITNGSISSVVNSTQGWSRVLIHMGVAYGTDIDLVKSVVNREGEAMYADPEWSNKLTEKPTFVGVTAFGESEITCRIWFRTKTFQNWGAEREFNLRLKRAFEEAGIDIPFPQRTLHMVHANPLTTEDS